MDLNLLATIIIIICVPWVGVNFDFDLLITPH